MSTELLLWAALCASVFCLASTAQAVTGFGSALVAVPLLALASSPVEAVVTTTAVCCLLAATGWRREHRQVDHSTARRFIGFGLLGMPVGLVLLQVLSDNVLTFFVAIGLLVAVALLWRNVTLPDTVATSRGAGVVSGAMLTSTGMNGPPLVIALASSNAPARTKRATLQMVFTIQGSVALASFAVLGSVDARVGAAVVGSMLGIPLGWEVGDRLFRRLSPLMLNRIVMTGLATTGVVSALSALPR